MITNRRTYILLFSFLLLFFSGCEKETIGNREEEVSFDLDLVACSDFNVVTRAHYPDTSLVVPETNDFKIQLFNTAGELLREWATYSSVPHPIKIQAGKFRIRASYGNPDKSGFDCPSFAGDTTVQLLSAATDKGIRENRITLSAKFANVLASVRHRESLKTHYKDYNTQIITSHDTVTFDKEEKRIAFLPVEDLKVVVNLTKHDSTTYSVPATTLTNTKAAEFYRLYVDVEGGGGNEKLLLSFDSTTIEKPIEIELSENWQSKKKPYLTPAFDTTGYHSFIRGENCNKGKFYTLITAIGKIGSCKIKTNSQSLIDAGWPAEVDLLNLTSANRNRLNKFGFTWPENMANANMAELDFSGIVAHLPAEDHTLTVEVADVYGQVSAPLSIHFRIIPPEFKLLPPDRPAIIRSLEYPFTVQMNGGDPDNIVIEYLNDYPDFGVTEWTPCEIKSRKWNDTKDQVLLQAGINMNKAAIQFRAKYDKKTSDEVTLHATNPTFQLEKQEPEWAYKASLNIKQTDGTNGLAQNTLAEQYTIQFSTDNTPWTDASYDNLEFNKTDNFIKFQLNDLHANQTYYVRVGFDAKAGLGICYSAPFEIKTEETTPVPSINDLPSTKEKEINKGGEYGYTTGIHSKHQAKETIYYYDYNKDVSPWATVNSKTMPSTATTYNTWYIIASTLPNKSNGILLRNVGWDNNGQTPPSKFGTYAWEATSLSDLNPPTIGHYSAGKLFLSSGYSYDHSNGTENYNEGIPFTSRPSALQFKYTYTPTNSDHAYAHIVVEDENGTAIGEGTATFGNQSNLTETNITVNYIIKDRKAAKLKIMFASSASCSYDQKNEDSTIKNLTTDNKAQAIRTGSEFYIEDVKLIYE